MKPRQSDSRSRPHVVGLCGSRRDGSYTLRALEETLSGVEAAGGTAHLLDLATLDLPVFDPDSDAGENAEQLRRAVRDADAVVLATPMYHGSYSGVLKNAIDYCGSEEFEDKTVGLLVVSGGSFPSSALDHLRVVCRSLRAWVLPLQAAIPRVRGAFDEDGISDASLRERVRDLGTQAVAYAALTPRPVAPVACQEL